jgi:DNA-binding NtrC family response regulator
MRPLKVLVVEDDEGPIKQVRDIANLFGESLSVGVEVRVMRMVPLRGEKVDQQVIEKSWDYDAIVLDLKVPISGAAVQGEGGSKYRLVGGEYGGCLAADLIAHSDFRGFVLSNSSYIKMWPSSLREGRSELERRGRLLYYDKTYHGDLDPMLRQVLRAAAEEMEFTSDLHQRILFAAATDHPVLLLGETGTGKELVAHSIHQHWSLTKVTGLNGTSAVKERPFFTINCALLSDELLRDELMGHAKGAFTGALQHKLGAILRAAGLSPAAVPQDNAKRGLDLGELNRTHAELIRNNASYSENPAQGVGRLLHAMTTFGEALVDASEQAKRFLERTVQNAAMVGSEAFNKWLRDLGGEQMAVPATASSSLDLVYNNEQSYGTIFLDEIGYLDATTQGMVLRLLSSYEVSPLGYEGSIKLRRLRVIAATSSRQWLRLADAQRTPAGGQVPFEEGPKADLYHRLAYHVIVLAGLQKSEVESFIKRKGKSESFWRSTEGTDIIAGIKNAVRNGEFLGHRRELEKLIDLIEAYLNTLPRLGRDDNPNPYDNVSWKFVKSNLWYPQKRSTVYDPKGNTPTTRTAEDMQKNIAEDKKKKIAYNIQKKIKEVVASYLGKVDWADGFNRLELKKKLDSVEDAKMNRELRGALSESVRLGRDRSIKDHKDEIAKIAVPDVGGYRALYDLVRFKAPKRKKN